MAAPIKKYFFSFDLRGNKLLNAKVKVPENDLEIANKLYVDSKTGLFVIDSLTNFDTELPLELRYEGMFFYVSDGIDFNGNSTGQLYTLESDLTKPIKLSDLSLRYIINQIYVENENYTELINILNAIPGKKPGQIVTVEPLHVTFIYSGGTGNFGNPDGTAPTWKYFSGDYSVSTQILFNTIPTDLLAINKKVILGSVEKVILSNKTLSDVIIIANTINDITENFRYYSLNGILYYRIGGNNYNLTEKIQVFDPQNLVIGNNQIFHTLKSTDIFVKMWIYSIDDNAVQNIPVDYNIVDIDSIKIKSALNISNVRLILTAKN